jgi:hypothetical protein
MGCVQVGLPSPRLEEIGWEAIEWGAEWDPATRWVDAEGVPVEYRNWTGATSRVVSGPYGPPWLSRFPGRRFPCRWMAREYWRARTRIIEEYRVPGRWIFRIPKERA